MHASNFSPPLVLSPAIRGRDSEQILDRKVWKTKAARGEKKSAKRCVQIGHRGVQDTSKKLPRSASKAPKRSQNGLKIEKNSYMSPRWLKIRTWRPKKPNPPSFRPPFGKAKRSLNPEKCSQNLMSCLTSISEGVFSHPGSILEVFWEGFWSRKRSEERIEQQKGGNAKK